MMAPVGGLLLERYSPPALHSSPSDGLAKGLSGNRRYKITFNENKVDLKANAPDGWIQNTDFQRRNGAKRGDGRSELSLRES
jgi:hypothetical protein